MVSEEKWWSTYIIIFSETCKKVSLTLQLQYQEYMPLCLEMPFEIYHLRWFQIRIAAALENMPMHLELPFEICLLRLFQIMLDLVLLAIKFWAETFKAGFCVLSHLQRIWPFWDFGIVISAEAMNQIHVYDRFMNQAHWW